MGCIYSRGNSLWIKFKNEAGVWQCKASGFKVGDERKAKAVLERVENLVGAGHEAKSDGPLTVKGWADVWLESRRAKGVLTVRHYAARLRDHILPVIGHMRLDEVRVTHIMDVVARARKANLAPRTVRHIYFVAHAMFRKALQRDLLISNPCTIDKDDLPAKVDKNPEWRARAIHTRDELEALISDERIPEWRRMFWALLFLTGMRFGEGAAGGGATAIPTPSRSASWSSTPATTTTSRSRRRRRRSSSATCRSIRSWPPSWRSGSSEGGSGRWGASRRKMI